MSRYCHAAVDMWRCHFPSSNHSFSYQIRVHTSPSERRVLSSTSACSASVFIVEANDAALFHAERSDTFQTAVPH